MDEQLELALPQLLSNRFSRKVMSGSASAHSRPPKIDTISRANVSFHSHEEVENN